MFAVSAYEEPLMAVTERTRTCFLCFIPDYYILGCPQLTPHQKAIAQQKRLAVSQIEKPFGIGDVPYGLKKPDGQSYRPTHHCFEKPNGHGNKPLGQPTGQVDRLYGQPYGYSRPFASKRVFPDARPPFRHAMWEVPPGGGERRIAEPNGPSVHHAETQEIPNEKELFEPTRIDS
jgi:hypothetical protein